MIVRKVLMAEREGFNILESVTDGCQRTSALSC